MWHRILAPNPSLLLYRSECRVGFATSPHQSPRTPVVAWLQKYLEVVAKIRNSSAKILEREALHFRNLFMCVFRNRVLELLYG